MMSTDHSHDRFATTRWSMVMRATSAEPADADRAFTELTQRYWYPVYAYVRRCGHAPAIAEEISRSFLYSVISRFRAETRRPPEGHFRRYLLDQLNEFLAGDWREVIENDGANLVAPPDLEARNQHDNAQAKSPEQAYEHSFAIEVVEQAMRRLRAEAQQTGRLDMFEALAPYLAQDPRAGEYPRMAQALKCPALTLVVALKRLRQRLRELVGQELADTVSSAEELALEQAALHAALRRDAQ